MVNPAKGLTIFNTTTNAQEINIGTGAAPTWSMVVVGGSAVPAGAVFHMATATVPAGYLEYNGQAVSRTTYATLFAVVGTTYGAGDGSTTFNLPDLRGEFIRGWDHGRGVDSGRAIATYQADALQNITGGVYTIAESFNGNGSASGAFAKTSGYNSSLTPGTTDISGAGAFDFDASRVVRTAAETRREIEL